jgi:hypothetical protein
MEERKDDLYITQTNLLSCEDVVAYLWNKYDKVSFPFKPAGAKSIEDKVTYGDKMDGALIKKRFQISVDDMRHIGLKNQQEYDVDHMEFTTFDHDKTVLSQGNLIIIFRPIEKFYYVLLLTDETNLKLMVKCTQKKKLFDSFPTETVSFY